MMAKLFYPILCIVFVSTFAIFASSGETRDSATFDLDELNRIENELRDYEALDTSSLSTEKPILEKHSGPEVIENGSQYLTDDEYLIVPDSSLESTNEPLENGDKEEPSDVLESKPEKHTGQSEKGCVHEKI